MSKKSSTFARFFVKKSMVMFKRRITFREFWRTYKSEMFFALILSLIMVAGHGLSYYIPEHLFNNTILPILHGAVSATCLGGAWVIFRHSDGLRIRLIYAWSLVIWGVADVFFLIQNYFLDIPVLELGTGQLTSYEMLWGNILGWLILVYPTEMLRPGWLSVKRAAMLLLPMIALVVLDYFIPTDLRFLIALYPIILTIWVLSHIRAYRIWCEDNYSSMEKIDAQWIVRYLIMACVMGVSYFYLCLSSNPARSFMQNILLIFMFGYSIGEVLFRRDPGFVTQEPEEEETLSENAAYREKLEQWMATDKPYLNPDFRLIDLRNVLPLNRTYLSQLIHTEYDCTFYEFVNRYRVEEAQRLMRENPSLKLNEISSMSGFSSPTYFIRIFTNTTEMTPGEWRKKILSA